MKKQPLIALLSIITVAGVLNCRTLIDVPPTLVQTNPPQVSRTPEEIITPEPVVSSPESQTPEEIITPDPVVSSPEPNVTENLLVSTLEILGNAVVPVNDPVELAYRFRGVDESSNSVAPPAAARTVGDSENFWVMNLDNVQNREVTATLQYVTEHVYFWIEQGVNFNSNDVRDLSETFENQIYPTDRAFFGSERLPGVDNDAHIYILYARDMGYNVAGYFSPNDSYPTWIAPYTNGHEMFFLSADNIGLNEGFTYGVLAHEFQHMIHFNLDRNESSFINEGFAELATLLNGYSVGGHDLSYIIDTDVQLNDWPEDNRTPHYGAAFLFLAYFLDRLGEEATQALAAHPANGLASLDIVLNEMGARDPLNGGSISADDLVLDWVLTNYLLDASVSDGRYTYQNYPGASQARETETLRDCNSSTQGRDVHQYGVDYISIECSGQSTLHFEGATETNLLPADAYSGDYAFWSNRGDESDMMLTRTFDFTAYDGPLTLNYWTWYDIELDWDYVYLLGSVDGENWEFLDTPSGTDYNPSGNSYGWGYTGFSGDGPVWMMESVDISQYAGQEVQIRFEYITDAAVNGEGLLLDDISIPETGYFSDFENDAGGWDAEGFVRVGNILPQTFRLALIAFGDTVTVEYLDLTANNVIDIPLDFTSDVDEYVFVVLGTARFTRQLADYAFSFLP